METVTEARRQLSSEEREKRRQAVFDRICELFEEDSRTFITDYIQHEATKEKASA
jgi:hypothetical protein